MPTYLNAPLWFEETWWDGLLIRSESDCHWLDEGHRDFLPDAATLTEQFNDWLTEYAASCLHVDMDSLPDASAQWIATFAAAEAVRVARELRESVGNGALDREVPGQHEWESSRL